MILLKEQLNQFNSLLPPKSGKHPTVLPSLHWLSHSLDCSMNQLDLPKQQKTSLVFFLNKKISSIVTHRGVWQAPTLAENLVKIRSSLGDGSGTKSLGNAEERTEAFAHVQER